MTTDPRGLTTKIDTPATTLTYDAASRPVEVTDATGSRTLTYDADNKLTSITSPARWHKLVEVSELNRELDTMKGAAPPPTLGAS